MNTSKLNVSNIKIIKNSLIKKKIFKLNNDLINELKNVNVKSIPKPKSKEKFSNYIDRIYKNKKELISEIYNFLPSSLVINKFIFSDQILKIVKNFGVTVPSLGSPPIIRIDTPDNKYSTPWHVDAAFSRNEKKSITIWIPLSDLNKNSGFIELQKELVLLKNIKFKVNKKNKFPLKIKNLNEFKTKNILQAKCNLGDILIFDQRILHRSGINKSSKCRISLQIRFNELYRAKKLQSTFKAVFNKLILKKNGKLIY